MSQDRPSKAELAEIAGVTEVTLRHSVQALWKMIDADRLEGREI